MCVSRSIGRDHTAENDFARRLDREFRSFNEIREISLEERLVDRRLAARMPEARGLGRKAPFLS